MADIEPHGLAEWNEHHRFLREIPEAIVAEDLDRFNSLLKDLKYKRQEVLSSALMTALSGYGNFKNKSVWKEMVLRILKTADPEKMEYLITWATQPRTYPEPVGRLLTEAYEIAKHGRGVGEKIGIEGSVAQRVNPDVANVIAKMLGRSRRVRRNRRKTRKARTKSD